MRELPAGWLAFDRGAGDLTGQIRRGLRDRILAGDLPGGSRLPSTRRLAATLGVSRTTVVAAFEQLDAEGYLTATSGAATRVARLPLSDAWRGPPPRAERPVPRPEAHGLFKPGVPELSRFPHRVWARCLAGRARSLRLHDLGYGDRTGLPALRQAILDHVGPSRGIVASADEIIIVPSASAAIALISRCLVVGAGAPVWIEDPGYESAREVFRDSGAELIPIPVDTEGMTTPADVPRPRVVYVTPSHQYPTGVVMSLRRRLALLDVARAAGALIIEDDYDCEFLGGPPIAALQSIDRGGVVAYVGTFSKSLAPGLRVAYVILPPPLVTDVARAQRLFGAYVPVHVQAAMVDFITEGHFRAHVRRAAAAYEANCQALVAALDRHCGALVRVESSQVGLQLCGWFRNADVDDRQVAEALARQGFAVEPLSRLYLGAGSPGLLIGLAGAANRAADLAQAIHDVVVDHPPFGPVVGGRVSHHTPMPGASQRS